MSKSKLSQTDAQFIDDLLSEKQTFFFKRKAKKGFDGKRRRRARFGITIGLTTDFIGISLAIGGREHRLGYTRH